MMSALAQSGDGKSIFPVSISTFTSSTRFEEDCRSPSLGLTSSYTCPLLHFSGMRSIILLLAAVVSAASGGTLRQVDQNWEVLSPIPIAPRQEHSVVALSGTRLAIAGGILPNLDNGVGFNTTAFIQFYDIHTDSWSEPIDAPIEVNHPNVAAVDGEIFLLGGLAVASDGAWRAFADSWKYHPSTGEWTALPPIPAGKAAGSATIGVLGNTIVLAGGMRTLEPIGVEGEQDTVDFVSMFDTKSCTWSHVPEAASVLPEGRDHAAGSVIGSRFYVLGGRLRGQYNVKDTVFVLDVDDMEAGWTTQGARMPTARGGVVGGNVGGKVYVFGGEGNTAEGSDGVFDNVEVYDVEFDTWQELGPMRLPRHGGAAATVGGKIYLPGGGIREGGSPVNVTDVFIVT
ncbi:kelch domain-containing protein [Colletotrichum graminicola]|nr:kelch domain-containing protein [Colletotrichum graminicola]